MAAPALAPNTRDLVVIGASAGGIEALPKLLSQLPPTFPASVLIVMHLGKSENPHLAQLLQRVTPLPVEWAEQGARLERGHVYVAPPDTHLAITDGHVRLSNGPRENFFRPSIDRVF